MTFGDSTERSEASAKAASSTASVPPSSPCAPRPFALPELIVVYKPAAGTESDPGSQPMRAEPFVTPQPSASEADAQAHHVEYTPADTPVRTPAREAARRPRGAIAALRRIFGRG